jgi:CRISPR-associated protein Cas2
MLRRHWHLISYDIRDPKRLREVAKTLEGYGTRIQYSIFRCRLDQKTLEKVHWELNQIMAAEDNLLVIPLCGVCSAKIPDHSTGDQTAWIETPGTTFRIL